jgi:hypothetical protein
MSDHAPAAPRRHEVGLLVLLAALVAAPTIWGLRLVLNFALASYFCFPGSIRHYALPGWTWPTLLGVDALALAVAVLAALASWRNWQASRDEAAAAGAPLIELGEGRTRFLALWGLMTGVGFAVAIGFDLVALWIVPVCA